MGVSLVAQLYAARDGSVLSVQPAGPQSLLAFMSVYRELIDVLAGEGLVCSNDRGPAIGDVPLAVPASLAVPLDVSAATLAPLQSMLSSASATTRREGLSAVALLAASSPGPICSQLVSLGLLAALERAEPLVNDDFEAHENCKCAITKLRAHALVA